MSRKTTTVSIDMELYNTAKLKGIKLSKILADALYKELNSVDYYESYDDKLEVLNNQHTRLESKMKTLKLSTNNTLNNIKEQYNLHVMTIKQDYEDNMLTLMQQFNSVEINIDKLVKSNTRTILKQEKSEDNEKLELTIVRNIIDHQIVSNIDPRIAPDTTDIKLLIGDSKLTWKDIDKYWSNSKFKNMLNDLIIERIKLNRSAEKE